jgi:hypothetical protein
MAAAKLDLTIERFRDYVISINVNTEQTNPFSLTGYTAVCTIKALPTDPDAKALYHSLPTSGSLALGQMSWLVPHTTTAGSGWAISSAVWDAAVQTPAGNRNTFVTGSVVIILPVTQTSFP